MGRSKGGDILVRLTFRAETLSAHLMSQLIDVSETLHSNEIETLFGACVQQTKEQGFNIAVMPSY